MVYMDRICKNFASILTINALYHIICKHFFHTKCIYQRIHFSVQFSSFFVYYIFIIVTNKEKIKMPYRIFLSFFINCIFLHVQFSYTLFPFCNLYKINKKKIQQNLIVIFWKKQQQK